MAYIGKSPSQAVRNRYYFTQSSNGATSLSGSDDASNTLTFADGNYVDVLLNGVTLVAGTDYNTSTANTIAGLSALSSGDVVEVVVYDTFSVFSGNVNGDFTVGGDIVVSGTVDSRDVNADGTKLDGIEASATADQTASEIRTLVESASDSNVFTDADHTKLNGIETSADVTDATNVASAGALMTTGGTLTGDLNFGDNDKAVFGAGSDLQIHHTNNNSFIEDVGTGNFLITTNGNNIQLMKNQAEQMLVAKTDGAVELYYDNAKKFETSSSGVDITGGFTATDGCTITTADNTAQLTLVSTDADASRGPELLLERLSGSPADNDALGFITWKFKNDGGTSHDYCGIEVLATDVSDGSEDATWQLFTQVAGTSRSRFSATPTETVFNEDSIDLDFRVESLGDANSFVVEGATKGIGMGTNDPTIDSSLAGVSVPSGSRYLHIHDGDGAVLKLTDPSSGANRGAQVAMLNTHMIVNNCENDALSFGTGNLSRMRIENTGYILTPYQPMFNAYLNGSDVADATTIVWNTTTTNVGSHYNTSNGRFTAPVSGKYFFSAFAMSINNASAFGIRAKINGVDQTYLWGYENFSATRHHVSISFVLTLSATDYVQIKTQGGAMHGSANYHNNFCGYLIG